MLFYGLLSLFLPAIFLVVIVWAGVTVLRAVTLPRKASRFSACGSCGYAVAELDSLVCPECGNDLRQSGIVTPRIEMIRRGSLTTAILAWTFLCGTGGYFLFSFVVLSVLFRSGFNVAASTNSWQQQLTPASGTYQSVTVVYESDFRSLTDVVDIELVLADGTTRTLTLDPTTERVEGEDSQLTDWSGDTLEAWYAEGGLDITDPALAAEAAEVGRYVDLLLMSPSTGSTSTFNHHTPNLTLGTTAASVQSAASMSRAGLAVIAAIVVSALVYVVGVVWIVLRRRKLLRSVDKAEVESLAA
ncbi:MAG: hypothetical protein HND58_01000 [Planctomycetota bacterium]|nr:MAG: hypothetical protein HND58_01000 [Planctomycetota bacterium]